MATITNTPAQWISTDQNEKHSFNLWHKWLAIADGQAPNRAVWFAASLIIMGVLFLPLPALLMYNYDAPIAVLAISMILFFGNFIAGMGGSNIRVTLTLFTASILIYLTMAAICIL